MALPEKPVLEKESAPIVEIPTVPPEIEHVESIAGSELNLPTPVTDDKTGQVILDNAAPQQVTVTLPLTEEEMNRALHLRIIYAARWLGEWMKRLLKIVSSKFLYQSSNT